ncbi:uncharacterized protein [Physcomitrium patens]|uniref:C2 domain-containing protein n=1 Tax=Physcomitrium patens TaxID=3218 RepID=A0A2K1JT19_PHYPA|nr:uncharacterized protein LOC112289001 [Physcomitrium patens]PNR44683.1 hypothetical protein PHYPA_014453 [Physcomitrium patens]|eukprot:XP_024389623.1 uncharacterized protein LOC112289001 [Physcomitrella patens]
MKEVRKLRVALHSATELKSANKMHVYAVLWMDPIVRVPTPTTKAQGRHPVFDTTVTLSLDDRTLRLGYLNIELLGQGLISTRRIGFVRVELSGILEEGSGGNAVLKEFRDYPVTRRSGRQQGFLSFDMHLQETSSCESVDTPKSDPKSRSLAVTPPPRPREFTLQQRFDLEGEQSDDMASPSSSSEAGDFQKAVSLRRRMYGMRPKSFSVNGLLSCY